MEKELHKELQLWRIIGMLRDDILTKLGLTLSTERIASLRPMASDVCASPPTTLVTIWPQKYDSLIFFPHNQFTL